LGIEIILKGGTAMEIRKNSSYNIEITGMTHEGQGVGRIDNFTVFVDGGIIGELIEVRIIKVNKSYAIGKLVSILKASAERIEPFCRVFNRCGGCSLQHMNYEAQLVFKTNLVKDAIKRIGKLEDVIIHDTIGMNEAMCYRNKAQYPVGILGSNVSIGFYAARTHEIIDCDVCGIQDAASGRVRTIVKEFVIKNKISVYDEVKGTGLLRHVMTRVGFKTGEVMVVLVVNGNDLPKKKELIEMLTSTPILPGIQSQLPVPKVHSIILNINTKETNIICGEKNITLFGKDTITDFIGRYKFEISPLSFFQVNPLQTEILYGKALEFADLKGNETVFDIYCGIGTISLFLSEKAKKVYGVEVVAEAVRDAKKNAEINKVNNVEFIEGEAEKVIPEIYKQGVKADVVVVDPPRKGCDEALLDTLVKMQPDRIVYVSCNPATLARDLNFLSGTGFRVVEVQPVDMFPWTGHVENVALVKRDMLT
jgi:23S rRNA (uracil1939-C5)-methyltransferase